MKISYLLAIGIAASVYSHVTFSGFISDSYTPGDTLTATTLNTIKTAVNDNHTMIAMQFSGDGSAGSLFINTNTDWSANPPANPYFINISIAPGATLTVPAGTTIRCSGSLINQGTILVLPGSESGSTGSISATTIPTGAMQATAHPGDTIRPASAGEFHDVSLFGGVLTLTGGGPGAAISETVAMTSFGNFKFGGGSGGGYANAVGDGGGLLKIYADVGITNIGTIDAQGNDASNDGSGGGGGGIVILAVHRGVVDNQGTINVSGGDGFGNTSYSGNGGGGGGGIIIKMSPSAPTSGVEMVAGGMGATDTKPVTANIRIAGGGGGGSGGQGGNGGVVSNTGVATPGFNGTAGYVISLTLDPIAIAR